MKTKKMLSLFLMSLFLIPSMVLADVMPMNRVTRKAGATCDIARKKDESSSSGRFTYRENHSRASKGVSVN